MPRPAGCAASTGDLIRAIDAGEADRARTLVHDHITGFYAAAGLTRAH